MNFRTNTYEFNQTPSSYLCPPQQQTHHQPTHQPTHQQQTVLQQTSSNIPTYLQQFTPRQPPFLQPPQENLIESPLPYYLSIESTNRDRTKYPSPSDYVFSLIPSDSNIGATRYTYRNIYEIALESVAIPYNASILAVPYLLLQIKEIEGHYDSAHTPTTKAFAKLYLKQVGSFMRLDKENCEPLIRVYYPAPLASLTKMSISICNPDGTLFNFGTDTTPPDAPDAAIQNSFTFRFKRRVVDVEDTIGHRDP